MQICQTAKSNPTFFSRPLLHLASKNILMESGNASLNFYPEVIEQALELVLGGETSVCQVSSDIPPFLKPTVVEHFQLVCDNEGNVPVMQTFLEHQQPAYASVAILERMDGLKADVKVKNILKRW